MLKKVALILLPFALFGGQESGNELVLSYGKQQIEWDPHRAYNTTEAQIFTAIYEGLVTYDPQTLRPRPGAAETWSLSPDGLTYTFKLRPGMKFSDGSPLDAYSFYRSFLRFLDPVSPKEYASFLDMVKNAQKYRQGELSDASQLGLQVLDNETLVIVLEHPAPYFLSLLSHHSMAPISQSQLPLLWQDPMRIAYSGPYVISEINDSMALLRKNPFYWDKDFVQIDRVRILFRNDVQDVSREFNRYTVDWAVDAFDPSLVSIKESLRIAARFSTNYYFFASQNPAFTDPRVRRALVSLIPLEQLRANQFIKAVTLVPPITGYPSPKGLEENREEALKMLKEAGYENGQGLPEVTIAEPYKGDKTALLIQQTLENLNIKSVIVTPEEGDYYRYIEEEQPTLASFSWIGDFLDPLAFLNMWTSGNALNFSSFHDKAFDDLLRTSNFQQSQERLKTLADAETMLLSSGAVIPLGHSPSFNLIDSKSVEGWYDNPLDIHPFKYLRFTGAYRVPGVLAMLMR